MRDKFVLKQITRLGKSAMGLYKSGGISGEEACRLRTHVTSPGVWQGTQSVRDALEKGLWWVIGEAWDKGTDEEKTRIESAADVENFLYALGEHGRDNGQPGPAARAWVRCAECEDKKKPSERDNPRAANALVEAARMYEQLGDEKKANELYARVETFGYGYATGSVNITRAKQLRAQGKTQEGMVLLERVASGQWGSDIAWSAMMQLAKWHTETGEPKKAIARWEEAARRYPWSLFAEIATERMGDQYRNQREYEKAAEAYMRALEILEGAPAGSSIWVHAESQSHKESIARVRLRRAECMHALARWDSVKEECSKVLAKVPHQVYEEWAQMILAERLLAQGHVEEAEKRLNEEVQKGLQPKFRNRARLDLADLRWRRGEKEEARKLLEAVLTDPEVRQDGYLAEMIRFAQERLPWRIEDSPKG